MADNYDVNKIKEKIRAVVNVSEQYKQNLGPKLIESNDLEQKVDSPIFKKFVPKIKWADKGKFTPTKIWGESNRWKPGYLATDMSKSVYEQAKPTEMPSEEWVLTYEKQKEAESEMPEVPIDELLEAEALTEQELRETEDIEKKKGKMDKKYAIDYIS